MLFRSMVGDDFFNEKIVKKVKADYKIGSEDVDGEYGSVEDNIIRIKSKVIAIDDILKGTLAAEKARKKDAQQAQEAAEQSAAENKLEAKPKKKKKKMKMIFL